MMHDDPSFRLVRPVPILGAPARTQTTSLATRAAGPIVLIAAWAIATTGGWISPVILPSPASVADALATLWTKDDLVGQLGVSLGRVLLGGGLGLATGLLLGLVAGLSRIGEEAYDSIVQMLRTIPPLALVPLFIVWFGIGETPKVLLIALATVFPMYLNTYAGVRNVDRRTIEAMRSFGLSGARLVWQVVIPLAMPSLLTGLRYSLGIAVLVLIAAEQINSAAGLGYLLNTAQVYQQVDVILICVAIYAAFGLLADLAVRLLERVLMPWRVHVAAR